MTARVLVVEHQASCPPHLVGRWLEEAGCTLAVCRPYAGDALPALTSYDGVLVMGGDMGAYDDDRAPWLPPLKALSATRSPRARRRSGSASATR